MSTALDVDDIIRHAGPVRHQHGQEIQPFWFVAEHVVDTPVVRAR